jgi:gluconokinase
VTAPPRVVLCGVAGCGKTTVGRALAGRLGVAFVDADDFHPPANVARMARGEPLDDDARAGWLAAVHGELARRVATGDGVVLACSALRARHRERLQSGLPPLRFVHLRVPAATLALRLAARVGHFFPASLLPNQLATWEELGADGLDVDGSGPPAAVAAKIAGALAAR